MTIFVYDMCIYNICARVYRYKLVKNMYVCNVM